MTRSAKFKSMPQDPHRFGSLAKGILSAFLEVAPDAMAVVGQAGLMVLVNSQMEEMFGYPPGTLAGKPVETLVPESLRDRHAARRSGFWSAPRPRGMGSDLELRGLRADGSEIPVEISLSPLETGEGRFVCCAVRDLTERRKLEDMRLRAALVDSSEDAIISHWQGRITSWNRAAERLLGYSAPEVLGRDVRMLLPPHLYEDVDKILELVSLGGRTDSLDTVRLDRAGQEVEVSITFSGMRGPDQVLEGISETLRGISLRKRTERQLKQAMEAAEAAHQQLESFSYSVAHDLKAPLRGIHSFSLILLEKYGERLDDQGRHYLSTVCHNSSYMGELIDNLLELARLARRRIAPTKLDLAELARASLARLQMADPTRQVEVFIPETLPDRGDIGLLGVVWDNLLGNAWKFTQQQPQARIEVGCARGVYFLKDNGAGFDMAFSAKLFGAFQRLHRRDEFPGLGIGLATVQRIIDLHGGKVWAEGEVGRGTTVYFTLDKPKLED